MPRRGTGKAQRNRKEEASTREKVLAVLTFLAILGCVYLVSYYLARPVVKQFPSDTGFKLSGFMSGIPRDAIHFRVVNSTEILSRPAGMELLANATLISLVLPPLNITPGDAGWVADVEVEEGALVNLLGMSPARAILLSGVLNGSGLPNQELLGVTVYGVRTANLSDAMVALSGSTLIYCEQGLGNISFLEKILRPLIVGESRAFDDEDMRKAYYLATEGGPFVGLSFTEFEGSSSDPDWLFSFARYSGETLEKVDAYKLATQQVAIDSFDEVRTDYFVRSYDYYIIGSFIVVSHNYQMEDLRTVILSL